MSYNYQVVNAQVESIRRGVLSQVYAWMTAGLLVTAAVAAYTANTPALLSLIFGSRWVWLGLLIAQIVLVIAIGPAITRLSPAVGTALFLLYSALNGLTMAAILLVYTQESIAAAFFATAGTFGAMSIYGFVTKRDLSGLRTYLVMGLIGFLIASLINIFLASTTLYWILTYGGVLLFVLLTAYDTQKIKNLAQQANTETDARRIAILGALTLYLDFINLFLLFLRIFGGRRG
jgi:hypothetical protein